ncbi:uncharacterized protein LOC125947674 [Dermacentor silvarum]|uniref:uncharacterized protein LOC125947674 n=1 Tax=Dermacentor silvarum TaxID=543639 RepID=UPI00210082CA|nr:uncharacterized protein LOC125947674 [Dermacentor silvarum]
MDVHILGGLKLATLICTCLAGIELKNSGRPHSRKPTLYSLFDVTYLVTCVGACAVLVRLVCHLIHIGSLWATWSPMLCFDLFVTCTFCAETVFMVVVFLVRRLRSQSAPWIICTVHGIILTTLVGDILEGTTTECTEQLTPYESMHRMDTVNRTMLLTCYAYLTLGSFLTAGFADRPMVRQELEVR